MTRAREISNVLGRNIESTTFTATAGQTAFSITHAAGRIQVYMNGLLLDPTVDWTSDGSTVTLTEGAVVGDELEVVKFDNLAVADVVPATGGTFTGAVTHSDDVTFNGDISIPDLPAFCLVRTTDVTGTANANSFITYESARFNTGSHASTSTGKFTAPVAGVYTFSIMFTVDGGDGSDDSVGCGWYIQNNSANYNVTPANTDNRINPRVLTRTGQEHTYGYSTTVKMAANATIGWYFVDWNATGTRLQSAEFSGHLVG